MFTNTYIYLFTIFFHTVLIWQWWFVVVRPSRSRRWYSRRRRSRRCRTESVGGVGERTVGSGAFSNTAEGTTFRRRKQCGSGSGGSGEKHDSLRLRRRRQSSSSPFSSSTTVVVVVIIMALTMATVTVLVSMKLMGKMTISFILINLVKSFLILFIITLVFSSGEGGVVYFCCCVL